jgi:hypothetical protein
MAVQQGPLEIPVAFLQRFKDALWKHTNVVPESQEEEIVLKDKFPTQSAQISVKRLQTGGWREQRSGPIGLCCHDNRDLKKKKKKRSWRGKRERISGRRLWLQCSERFPWGRVQTQEHLLNVDRQAISGGSVPWGSHLRGPAPFAGEIIGRHTVLGSQRNQDQSFPPNDRSWGLLSRLLWPP